MSEENAPFKAFGDRIKFLREQWRQSIDEVSSAIEISKTTLADIESGKVLPDFEVLDMMISHFLLTEDQADDLRELADAGQSNGGVPKNTPGLEELMAKQLVMMLPAVDNTKIIYTDGMHANINDNGVVLQFMQQMPEGNKPAIVSRVGMSREHAEKMVKVLNQTIKKFDQNKQTTDTVSEKSEKSTKPQSKKPKSSDESK